MALGTVMYEGVGLEWKNDPISPSKTQTSLVAAFESSFLYLVGAEAGRAAWDPTASAGFLVGKLRLREVLVGNVALFHSLILFKSFYGLVVRERSFLPLHFTPGCDEDTPAIPVLDCVVRSEVKTKSKYKGRPKHKVKN